MNNDQIVVRSQSDYDAVPKGFNGRIIIKSDTLVVIRNSSVVARGNSSVVARGNSSVEAWDNSSVEAWNNSSVVAWDNSSVEAWNNSSVEAWGNSSVEAGDNSSVVAGDNSSVEAWNNSSVVAWDNSSVEAWGAVQVVGRYASKKSDVSLHGISRFVCYPSDIQSYIDFFNVQLSGKKLILYKAVHKSESGGFYFSDYCSSFTYRIGESVAEPATDKDPAKDCAWGLHVAPLHWALNFGCRWRDLALLEVEVSPEDIVVPRGTDGKVRCSELKVIREVPLSECGLYGKLIEKRLGNDA